MILICYSIKAGINDEKKKKVGEIISDKSLFTVS